MHDSDVQFTAQEALDFQIEEIRGILPGYAKVGIGNLGGSEGMHNAIFYDAAKFDLDGDGRVTLDEIGTSRAVITTLTDAIIVTHSRLRFGSCCAW